MVKLNSKKSKKEQYGRVKGQKNIKRHGGYVYNEHGVEFTEQEYKNLQSSVNSVNRKKKRFIGDESLQGVVLGYKGNGKFKDDVDLLFTNHSKSLHQFKSRDEYDNMMKKLDKIKHKDYVENRITEIKEMYAKGVGSAFGGSDEVTELIDKITNMSNKDFSELLNDDFITSIQFMYGKEEEERRLATVRNRFGLDAFDGEVFTDAYRQPVSGLNYKPVAKKPKKKQPKLKLPKLGV